MKNIILLLISLFLITCGGGGPTEPPPPTNPIVQNINLDTIEDTPKTFVFMGIDPQYAALTYSLSTQPQYGTLTINGESGTYTPNINYIGTDTFQYKASSVNGISNLGNITIIIYSDESDEWSQTIGTSGNDIAYSVQQTSDGGYILAGTDGDDMYLVKTDSQGNKEWDQSFGGSGNDVAYALDQTFDGGYILAGNNSSDIYIVKTDSQGNELWNKTIEGDNTYGNTGENTLYSIQQTFDGGYILAGRICCNNSIFRPMKVLIKIDSQGSKEWTHNWTGSHLPLDYSLRTHSFTSVQQTFDGGYLVASNTPDAANPSSSAMKVDSGGNFHGWRVSDSSLRRAYSVQETSDGGCIVVGTNAIKADSQGNIEWIHTFIGGSYHYIVMYFVQQTSDGGFIMVGKEPEGIHVLKLDATGIEEWHKKIGESDNDIAYSVQQTFDGGYIVAGTDGNDMYLIKMDGKGNRIF